MLWLGTQQQGCACTTHSPRALACAGTPPCTHSSPGHTLSQADVALMPFVDRFELALGSFQGYVLTALADGAIFRWLVGCWRAGVGGCGRSRHGDRGASWRDIDGTEPAAAAYAVWVQEAMRTDEPGRLTCAARELQLAAYRQHEALDFFDYETYNVTDLHPHLAAWQVDDA